MPAVFTNAGLFTFRKLTDTQTQPTGLGSSLWANHDRQKSLMQTLLTRTGTDCAFRKERVSSNRLYLGEGRSHEVATKGSWKHSLWSTNRVVLSCVAIPRQSLHAGICRWLDRMLFWSTCYPPGVICGVIIILPCMRDIIRKGSVKYPFSTGFKIYWKTKLKLTINIRSPTHEGA